MDAAWSVRIKYGEKDGYWMDETCSSKERGWINTWKRSYTTYCDLSIFILC